MRGGRFQKPEAIFDEGLGAPGILDLPLSNASKLLWEHGLKMG